MTAGLAQGCAALPYRLPPSPPFPNPPTHIQQNDVITLNKRFALDHEVKLSISHALAQSTKLAVYEERLQVG